jgi:hypothetical protein
MANTDSASVAARLRSLIGWPVRASVADIALLLDVSEVELRRSIDETAPQPMLDVIIAAVRYYGVDPTWLMTGEYDLAQHRKVVADDDPLSTAEIANLIGTIAAGGSGDDGRLLRLTT